MRDRLEIDDPSLLLAGSLLAHAAKAVIDGGISPPHIELPSVNGIGERARWFLEGVSTASAALSDAAASAARAVAGIMQTSTELDAMLAAELGDGYAVPQVRQPKP
ncbi:hypothetical protein [Leucobacter sp. W1478]|uniref:hypothetical protein n=1 Tax=Leucobacter sp. W1478 TaxID=3439065 RepID=UPI003F38F89D